VSATHDLDCKGLRCPMPIVRLGLAFRSLATGDRLRVEATDPAFEADLAAWAKKLGHAVLSFERGDVQSAVIEKRGGS